MRRDPIVIGPYDPSWPASFDAQQSRITPALAPWLTRDIEHMGSTAVPELPAKDIVDMLAVVAVIQPVRSAIEPMAAAGWLHAPERYDAPESRLSFCFPSIEHRTHHLHVVEDASPDWRGWLAFRDRLRADYSVAREYASLKTALAAEHGDDPDQRDAYRGGKAAFIRGVTEAALRDATPTREPR